MKILAVVLLWGFLTPALSEGQTSDGTKATESAAVQSIRIEKSKIDLKSGKPVEGERFLLETKSYDTAGHLTGSNSYKPDGSLYASYLATYDASGTKTEETYRNARGVILARTVYSYDAQGELSGKIHFEEKDKPAGKTVLRRGANGEITDSTRYDQRDVLKEKETYVYKESTRTLEDYSYDEKEKRTEKTVREYDAAGREVGYTVRNSDGSPRGWIGKYDDRGNLVVDEFRNIDGLNRWRYFLEFDQQGNWVKQSTASLMNKGGSPAYETSEVTYRTITYYAGVKSSRTERQMTLAEAVEEKEKQFTLNGKATKLVKPTYPDEARVARVKGMIEVQVLVGNDGDILSARSKGGHPLLRQAAEAAAWQCKLLPTLSGGEATRATGIINFNFEL